MSRTLDVWFYGNKAGRLVQDDSGRLSFAYDADYLKSRAWPLSVSLPLREEEFGDHVARPFFSGLLPDDLVRKKIARLVGVSEKNPFSLLEIIGGECAGAVAFYPEGTSPHQENHEDIQILDEHHLDEIFDHLKRRPLFAGEKDIRLSLAGAQDKLAVRMIGDKIALMRGGAPTTHILKTLMVGREEIKDSVHNELFCLMLAARCGISAAQAQIRHTAKEPFLLVERYDRKWQGDNVVRLHQEDFCQALSVPPENKYEREGGPGILACLDEIQRHSVQPIPDRIAFLNAVIFNYLIGNADAHGKNFSLLHEEGKPRLAPAYDLLSTAVYSTLSPKMAMKIGGKYEPEEVHLRHWLRLVPDSVTARNAMEKSLVEMSGKALDQAAQLKGDLKKAEITSPIFEGILGVIKQRSTNILNKRD
ncbi:MAG: type II toxin-antitoxin system HipA family toxin [Chthoniobacteraceae bacterium]